MTCHRRIALAVAAAALAAPAAASADSIVYLDGSAVWSASPDGSKKVQLSDTGMYHSVAQADDGTIAAAAGNGIDILARDGRPIKHLVTQPAHTANGGWHKGVPFNLSFSPDGTKLAYEYTDLACPPASNCSQQHSVLYTRVDGPAPSPFDTYGQQYSRQDPSFLTNDRAVLFGGAGSWVNFDDLGGGDDSNERWIGDTGDIADGEISRDGRRFAAVLGYDEKATLGFFTLSTDARTATPDRISSDDLVCSADMDKKYGGLTWSPDGSAAAFESKAGVGIVRFGSFTPGTCDVAASSVLGETAKEPDWGPADPATARYSDTVTVTPTPTPTVTPPKTNPPAVNAPKVLTAKATRAALRKGAKVTVQVPAAGKVTVRLGKVAKGTATAKAAGTVTVKLSKVSRKAAKKLRGKLALTVITTTGKVSSTIKVS